MASDEVKIPDWVWAKKYYAGGHRLQKFVKWYSRNTAPVKPGGLWTPAKSVDLNAPRKEDALTIGDLRYWRGQQNEHMRNYGTCRACGFSSVSSELRKKHLQEGVCNVLMAGTMRELRKQNICGACGKTTKEQKWGIPICSKPCEHEFAYEFSKPPIYRKIFDEIHDEIKKQMAGRPSPY